MGPLAEKVNLFPYQKKAWFRKNEAKVSSGNMGVATQLSGPYLRPPPSK